MRLDRSRALVVGGGIGGMAAALALARAGAQVTLHERAEAFGDVGAGLQVSANGQAALRSLGLCGDGPPAGAVLSEGTAIRAPSGRTVARVPPPRSGATWYIHRADLLSLLTEAATAAGVDMRMSSAVRPGSATAGAADLLVAADGGLSDWRGAIDARVRAQFTGQVAWRALLPGRGEARAPAVLAMGPGAHVVSYPLRDGSLRNLVAVEERRDFTGEGWRQKGDPEVFRRRFARFGAVLGHDLGALREVHLWGLHLRPVAARWQDGKRAALLGDAAHPTLPFLAQGANLALEDAVILGRALDLAGTIPEALARYEAARRPRAEAVVRLARGNAWRFHLRPPLSWGAQAVLAVGGGLLARGLERVYAYDPSEAPI